MEFKERDKQTKKQSRGDTSQIFMSLERIKMRIAYNFFAIFFFFCKHFIKFTRILDTYI